MAQKRRITAQLISTTPSSEAGLSLTATTPQANAQPIALTAPPKSKMTLKEQAEYAAKHLGPGRRIYVQLKKDGNNVVSWKKVCMANCLPKCKFRTLPTHSDGQFKIVLL